MTERLRALREDLQHNKDALRLRNLGSKLDFQFSKGICPTCQQPIKDVLLQQETRASTMSLDENISFIESQVVLFEAMKSNAEKVLEAKRRQLDSFRSRADSLRSQIRGYKKTLVSDDRAPSESAIRERLELEARVTQTENLEQALSQQYAMLARVVEDYNSALKRLKSLQDEELSPDDRITLNTLERSFVEQIKLYGLSSVPPDSIKISDNTYRPSHEGFDLGFDLSASDMIRTIWAYLNGLLETSRVRPTNHPGFLIFDEPRQQEAARVSFKKLLARASESKKHNQQVIFATSEEESVLSNMLSTIPCNLVSIRGKVLKPIQS